MRAIRGNDIAMIFQEPMTSLNPVFTVGDQIIRPSCCTSSFRAVPPARPRALLEKVRLPDAEALLDRYPHQLSGGMRQRVMIAMALSCQPRLLIADEPTTALDVTIQAQILNTVRALQRDLGTAVIFITHDMGVVAENGRRRGGDAARQEGRTGHGGRDLPRAQAPIPAPCWPPCRAWAA